MRVTDGGGGVAGLDMPLMGSISYPDFQEAAPANVPYLSIARTSSMVSASAGVLSSR